jgi:hypothetical protein
MTQEEKQLLLKDLSARFPYEVIVNDGNETDILAGYMLEDLMFIDEAIIRPYLRPMSSMTEEERKYYNSLSILIADSECEVYEEMDWLNAHHFDYRGLIKKGLALEAPEGMYKND